MENNNLLNQLSKYINSLELKANTYDGIMNFFYSNKRLSPIYRKVRDEVLRNNCQSSSSTVIATLEHMLNKIEDLENYEKLYDEIKYKKSEEIQEPALIPISSNEIKVLSMIYNNKISQLEKIPIGLFVNLIGLSEEEYQIILNKFKRLGLYESGEPTGYLTEKGRRFFEEIDINGKE